jgi:lysyl-tRNA synthetase class I
MRNWINGAHFPSELRISVRKERMAGIDENISEGLSQSLADCEWNTKAIAEAISSCFKNNGISPKEGYRNLYLAILGVEKGPRLAPILSELERTRVLELLG